MHRCADGQSDVRPSGRIVRAGHGGHRRRGTRCGSPVRPDPLRRSALRSCYLLARPVAGEPWRAHRGRMRWMALAALALAGCGPVGAGSVMCAEGFAVCGPHDAGPEYVPTCADLSTDPNNCGACGQTCSQGDVCTDGACTTPPPMCNGGPACSSSSMCCSAGCADLSTDPNNCGSCGRVCPPLSGGSLSGGTCNTDPGPCMSGHCVAEECAQTSDCCVAQTTCQSGLCKLP